MGTTVLGAAAVFLTIVFLEAAIYSHATDLPLGKAFDTALLAALLGGLAAIPLLPWTMRQAWGASPGAWFATVLAPAALADALLQVLVTVGLNWSFEKRGRLLGVAAAVTSAVTLPAFALLALWWAAAAAP